MYGYVSNDPLNAIDPYGLHEDVPAGEHWSPINDAMGQKIFNDNLLAANQNAERAAFVAAYVQAVEDSREREWGAKHPVLAFLKEVMETGMQYDNSTGMASCTAENLVYQSVNSAREVNYVGITKSFERRAAAQLAQKGIYNSTHTRPSESLTHRCQSR